MHTIYLKSRQLSGPGCGDQAFQRLPTEWAVINSIHPGFEPSGCHWPHLIRCSTKASADSYIRGVVRDFAHRPETGLRYVQEA